MTAEYRVHSFHISVGAGDGAVHLLLSQSNVLGQTVLDITKPGLVVAATWIDGGPGDHGALKVLPTFENIKALYQFPEDPVAKAPLFKLDSVVITHWDNDHYGGVLALIIDDLRQKCYKAIQAANPQNELDVLHAWNAALVDPKNKFTYGRYDETSNKPLTTLIVPYWLLKDAVTPNLQEGKCAGEHSAWIKLDTTAPTMPTVSFVLDTWWTDESIGIKKLILPGQVDGVLKVLYGYGNVIGTDLFSPQKTLASALSVSYNAILNKDNLIDPNNRHNIPVTRPGMYCVGADSEVVGPNQSHAFMTEKESSTNHGKTASPPVQTTELGLVSNEGFPPVEVVDENPSGSNRSSIIALLIWHKPPVPPGPQILHYTAGDAEYEEEGLIADWTGADGTEANRIPVMKLSHHGSKTSTPTKLLDVFQSDWVIVSAGTMHKHPTWEVLVYLDLVISSQRAKPFLTAYIPDKPFLPMGWPYWMLRLPNNTFREAFSITELKKIPNTSNAFVTRLLEVEAAAGGNFFANFQTNYGKTSIANQKDQLVTELENRMTANITRLIKSQNVFPSDTRIVEQKSVYTDNDILYHLISIRAGEKPIHYVGTTNTPPILPAVPAAALLPPTAPDGGRGGNPAKRILKATSYPSRFEAYLLNNRITRIVYLNIRRAVSRPMKYLRGTPDEDAFSFVKLDNFENLPPVILPPQNPTDSNFYILSTDWGVGPSSDPMVTNLTAQTDEDNFVAGLESASLALSTTPSSSTESGLGIPLSQGDYWLYWMKMNYMQATNVYVQAVQTAPQQYSILGYAVTLGLVPPLTPNNTPYKLTYTSAAAQDAFRFNNLPLPSIPSTGVIKDFAMLIMGVDPTSPDIGRSMSIVDLMQMFGINQGVFGLAEDLQLILDTTPGARNAMWYTPSYDQSVYLRLKYTVQNISSLQDILDDIFQKGTVTITNPFVVVKTQSSQRMLGNNVNDASLPAYTVFNESELILGATFTTSPTFGFSVFFDYLQGHCMSMTLTFNGEVDLGTLLTGLERVVTKAVSAITGGVELPNLSDWLAKVNASSLLKAADAIKFRQIVLMVSQSYNSDGSPGRRSVASAQLTFEVGMNIGQDPGSDKNVVFMLTFNWPSIVFTGTLFFDIVPQPDTFPVLLTPEQEYSMPYYEEYRMLRPITDNLAQTLKLTKLIPLPGITIPDPPDFIPNDVDQLSMEFGKDAGGSLYTSFRATVTCDATVKGTVPTLAIDYITVSLSHNFGTKVTDIQLVADVLLNVRPPANSAITPLPEASLNVEIDYDTNDGWQLTANLQDLTLGHLYGVCETAYSDALMDILENIGVKKMNVLYTFGGGVANYFMFSGKILIGPLELDFYYESKAGQWKFDAYLGASSPSATLFEVINDICGSDVTASLPAAANIPITVPSDSTKDFVSLHVTKHEGGPADGNGTLAMSLMVNFGGGKTMTFVQLQTKSSAGLRSMAAGTAAPPPKRVFRFALGGVPDASNIPLVGRLPQSYDAMEFMWVGGGDPSFPGGLTRGDVQLINGVLKDSNAEILFQDLTKTTPVDLTQLVLPNGCHFVMVMNDKVILDYLFNEPTPTAPSSALVSQAGKPVSRRADDEGGDTSQTTMAPMKKSLGPFSISNVGLRYHDETIWVMMTASVMLGPIAFDLLEFGIGLKISGLTLDNLLQIPDISFTLSGLGVEFNEPPITVAGLFLAKNDYYMGGVIIGFDPYIIKAVGAYGTYADASGDKFKTAFLYGEVEGPIAEIEGAEITGLKLGFGYNSAIKNPDFTTISNFPFTTQAASVPGAQNDPLSLMTKFCLPDPTTGILWIVPTNGSLWLVAGLTVLAFEVINVSAIVVIEFNPAVSLSVFADAIAALPLDAPSPNEAFLYIEYAMIATCDFSHGTFIDQAQLTPKSFVLSPSCHLTGGYALATWFPPSPYAGEWVVSIGGYHPAYVPATYYPVPPRLGISWNLDGCISISGGAYFAVTPKACMGGGNLNATFSAGPLGAHFSAWADFLINYHPFYFTGSIGVSVGVSFTLDLWICTIYINVDIGASLSIHGPPFQGVVHVDFWVFGFDINFGSGSLAQALDWPSFWLMLCTVNAQDPSGTDTNGPNTQLIHALQTGGVPSQGTIQTKRLKTVDPWLIRAGSFSFEVQSRMPMTSVIVNKNDPPSMSQLLASDYTTDNIYSKPMQKSDAFISELDITIDGVPDAFRLAPTMKRMPKGIWGAYDSSTDPTTSSDGNYVPTLLTATDPASLLMTGLVLTVPLPIKGTDTIPTFNAILANRSDVNHPDPDESLATTPPAQGGEFVPSPKWPPATGEVIRQDWIAGGTAMPASEAPTSQEKDGPPLPPPLPTVESFTTQWATMFGFPLVNVLDLVTKQVTQHPLVSAPPQEALLKDQPSWEGYFVVEPRLGVATTTSTMVESF